MIYFLYGLGIILALLILLLFAPFSLHFYYLEEFKASIRFLCFKFNLFPMEEKKEKAEKEKKPKKEKTPGEEQKPEEEKKKRPYKETFDTALRILKNIRLPFKKFLKKVKITKLRIEIMAAAGDAYKTSQDFLKINAAVTSLLNLLDNIFTLKAESLYVYPDFKEEKTKYYLEGNIKLNAMQGIIFLLTVLVQNKNDIMKLMK